MTLLGMFCKDILLLRAVTNSVEYSSRELILAEVVKKLAVCMDPNSLLPGPSTRKSNNSQLYTVCIFILFPRAMFIQPSSFRRPVRSGFFHRLRIRLHLLNMITVIFYEWSHVWKRRQMQRRFQLRDLKERTT
jgi:hypothetical protein